MINQGLIGKLITAVLILSLFVSPVLCAEDFTVNIIASGGPPVDPITLVIISVNPEDELQLGLNDGQRLEVLLNLSADTEWFVNGELVLTQLGLSDPFYYFTPSTTGIINITSSSTNIVSPFNTVTYTWWVDIDTTYYVISPVRPVLPPEEEEEEEEEKSSFVADIIDDITPPHRGVFDSEIITTIERGLNSVDQIMTNMVTFTFTGNNWFALMFGFLGVIIAGVLSKEKDIPLNIILIGSPSIIVLLTVNEIFSILNDSFIINSLIFLLSCGFIAMVIFNMKEIQEIPRMLEA